MCPLNPRPSTLLPQLGRGVGDYLLKSTDWLLQVRHSTARDLGQGVIAARGGGPCSARTRLAIYDCAVHSTSRAWTADDDVCLREKI